MQKIDHPISFSRLQQKVKELAYTMKLLTYRTCPTLVEQLDINEDRIFLDPLLFAYFNNPVTCYLPTIEQLLYGYLHPTKRLMPIPIVFDPHQITYVSNIGYFVVRAALKMEPYFLQQVDNQYIIKSKSGEPIAFDFLPPLYAEGFEVFRFNHPLAFHFLEQLSEHPLKYAQIEVNEITDLKLETVQSVIRILQERFPDFYKNVKDTNFRFMIFNHEPINSFVIKRFHGAIFMNANPKSSAAFFIDDLVHQWSHNILNTFITHLPDYFKLDVENEIMAQHTGQSYDDRTIYGAFHGLFTVAQRVACFRNLYKCNHLEVAEQKEVLARFCDQQRRFNTGLEQLNLDAVYTSKGKQLYRHLVKMTEDGLQEIAPLLSKVHFSNQVSRFSYEKFVAINTL
jgi:hypothetical protein